jgi:DNA repair exonuclease SbcCD nuclease subunit
MNKQFLYVGDPHIQIQNLEDAEKLLSHIYDMVSGSTPPDRVVFLGDLLHTHAIVRVEVLEFWRRWLFQISSFVPVTILVGNHDMTGDYSSKATALSLFASGRVTVVDEPLAEGAIGFLPYIHSQEEFIDSANGLVSRGVRTIVCHQSFSGSKFENGYFDPHGINPDLLTATLIISGHIHMQQKFGKVWHPGTPMWLTASDANQEKGLWLVDHSPDGDIAGLSFIDTSKIVTPIVSVQWKQGEPKPSLPENAKATVELIGCAEWVSANKSELKGISVQSTFTDKAKIRMTKTTSFEEFVDSEFELPPEIEKTEFKDFLKEMGLVG